MNNCHPKQMLAIVGAFVLFFGCITLIAVCLETGMKCHGEEYRQFNIFKGYNRCYVIDQDWKAIILIVVGALSIAVLFGVSILLLIKWRRESERSYGKGGLFDYAVKGQEAKNALSQHM